MTCEELDRLEALFRKIAGSHYLGGYDAAVWDHAVYKAAPALLAAARERNEQAAELARLRAELERVTHIAAEYRSALQDVRANLHAMGKRPEHCYEMSIIDDALAQEPPA